MVTGYGVSRVLHAGNAPRVIEKEKGAYGVMLSSEMYLKERPFETNITRGRRTHHFLKQLSEPLSFWQANTRGEICRRRGDSFSLL